VTRKNLEKFGFPMGGTTDTMLMARKQPDWGSAKGTRRESAPFNHDFKLSESEPRNLKRGVLDAWPGP
jgi:hypothetical protein